MLFTHTCKDKEKIIGIFVLILMQKHFESSSVLQFQSRVQSLDINKSMHKRTILTSQSPASNENDEEIPRTLSWSGRQRIIRQSTDNNDNQLTISKTPLQISQSSSLEDLADQKTSKKVSAEVENCRIALSTMYHVPKFRLR